MPAAPLRALFACYMDFANVATDTAAALRSTGRWDTRVACIQQHPFLYPLKHDFDWGGLSAPLAKWMAEGPIDVFFYAEEVSAGLHPTTLRASFYSKEGGFGSLLDRILPVPLPMVRRRVVFHAGTAYRAGFEWYNAVDPFFFDAAMVSPDLHRLNPKALPLFGKPILPPGGENHPVWTPGADGRVAIRVVHAPSLGDSLKGTHAIIAAATAAAAAANAASADRTIEFLTIGGPLGTPEWLPNPELMERRASANIYIDQFSTVGGIGISSLESMACGLITVCTTFAVSDAAWAEVGGRAACPIVSAPARASEGAASAAEISELTAILQELFLRPLPELRALSEASKVWTKQYLSAAAVAERFENLIASIEPTVVDPVIERGLVGLLRVRPEAAFPPDGAAVIAAARAAVIAGGEAAAEVQPFLAASWARGKPSMRAVTAAAAGCPAVASAFAGAAPEGQNVARAAFRAIAERLNGTSRGRAFETLLHVLPPFHTFILSPGALDPAVPDALDEVLRHLTPGPEEALITALRNLAAHR